MKADPFQAGSWLTIPEELNATIQATDANARIAKIAHLIEMEEQDAPFRRYARRR